MRMDNFDCLAHPRIRRLITGEFEPPLLSCQPYLDHMRSKMPAGQDYVFDHSTADDDIKSMREDGLHQLADRCERLLDNPPAYDGFRPCNNAVFHAMIKSLKADDLYIVRTVNYYGDGIGIRNRIWDAMTGDACKSKKLLAMGHSNKIAEVKYRFERHGVVKYFSKIHAEIAKLRTLGAQKQDWEIFSIVFEHMSQQCMEFRDAVADIRDKLSKQRRRECYLEVHRISIPTQRDSL